MDWRIGACPDCIDDDGELRSVLVRDRRGRWSEARGLDVNRLLTRAAIMGWPVSKAAATVRLTPLEAPPPRTWVMNDAEAEAWAAYMEMGLLRDMALVHTARELVLMGADGLARDLRERLDALEVPMTDDMVEVIAEALVRRAAEAVLGLSEDGR